MAWPRTQSLTAASPGVRLQVCVQVCLVNTGDRYVQEMVKSSQASAIFPLSTRTLLCNYPKYWFSSLRMSSIFINRYGYCLFEPSFQATPETLSFMAIFIFPYKIIKCY